MTRPVARTTLAPNLSLLAERVDGRAEWGTCGGDVEGATWDVTAGGQSMLAEMGSDVRVTMSRK